MHGSQTQETYERAGFGATVVRGTQPAIVVVDLSRGFTEAGFPSGSDLTDTVEQTSRLLRVAAEQHLPTVLTVIAYDAAEAEGTAVRWLDKAPGMRELREGSEAVALDPRLPRWDGDQVVVKKGPSAFFGTNLAGTLTSRGVDTVIVCGATTSGCVRATVVDAVQYGFSVLVPRECVGDRAAGPHDANLFDIDQKYGDVISTDEALAYLEGLRPERRA